MGFEKSMLSPQDLVEIVERASSRAERVAPDSLPAWASTLSAGLEAAAALERESGGSLTARYGNADQPTPFEELLLPFVLLARERLGERVGAAVGQLTEAACARLERSLLQRLARVCAAPLDLEFSIFRAARQSSFTRLLGMLQEDAPRELYRQFIERMLTGGLKRFFHEYPVLARLVATLTDFWVDAVVEFLLRLDADGPDLEAAFSAGARLDRVAAIETGMSDSHNRGRSVLAMTFESGLKIVYKPRDVGPEEAYFGLLAWLNDHGSPLGFKLLRVLRRPGYGWVEFVEQLPCADASEAERYYRRAGMLLALLHALGGTDFHQENLIASGEHPVLVDLETVLSHRVKPFQSPVQALAHLHFHNSVLSTGLLPQWLIGSEGRSFDTSGLGGVGNHERPYRSPTWDSPNTDRMRMLHEFAQPRASRNAVVLGGEDYKFFHSEGEATTVDSHPEGGSCTTTVLGSGLP